jgi:hypothetical protein
MTIGGIILIAFDIIAIITLLIILCLYIKGTRNYVRDLSAKIMGKYKFDSNDRRIFKDKWKDIV